MTPVFEDYEKLSRKYQKKGYAHVRGVLSEEVASIFLSMTQLAMGDTAQDQARFAAQMKPLNMTAYDLYSRNYPAAMTLLWGLTPFAERAVGRSLLPTYAYFRVYQKDALCLIHSDREACEHSMSLTLGSSDGRVWPFEIGRKRVADVTNPPAIADSFGEEPHASIEMAPGDAVLYQGVNYRHGRQTPNPNAWSAHIFLHWIDRNGPYREHAFDKRQLPPPARFQFA